MRATWTTRWWPVPVGAVEVHFSKFLRRYDIKVIEGKVYAGSREAVDYAIFEINKRARPRRHVCNPTREARRTDFGLRLEREAERLARERSKAKETR